MFSVLFHRCAHESEEGSSCELFKYYNSTNYAEIEKCIHEWAYEQYSLQFQYTTQYNYPDWKHHYGEFGIMLTYNGEVIDISREFSSGDIYQLSHTDKTQDAIDSLPDICLDDILSDIEYKLRSLFRVVQEFKKTVHKETDMIRSAMKTKEIEDKERQQLQKLLEKYPDMVK